MSSWGRMYRLMVCQPLPTDGEIDRSAKHENILGIAQRGKTWGREPACKLAASHTNFQCHLLSLPLILLFPCISLFHILPTFFVPVYPVNLFLCHFHSPLCPTHIGCHLSFLLQTVTPPSSTSQLLLAFPPSKGCMVYTHACNIGSQPMGTEL